MQKKFKLIPLCAALTLLGLHGVAFAQTATQDTLLQKLEQMSAEIDKLNAEVTQLKSAQNKTEATAQQASQTAAQAQTDTQSAAASVAGTGMSAPGAPATVLTGYGEINYNHPTKNASATQADLRRAVIGLQHRFDDRTKFVGEFEWEHAVTSASDRGEAAVEQAYVEHQLHPALAVRGGLFLVPMGLLNENHEPTAYYGVERNFVETAIIPSTWREGGAMLIGTTEQGLTWKAGVSTGFTISKWDPTSTDGKQSPLGSVHQELQLAKARNLSVFGSLDWRGVPGLLVGAGLFTGQAGQGLTASNPTVTVWDLHTRWTPGKWDLAAVYASGSISGTGPLNADFAATDPTPIPAKFDGMYVQAAYTLWSSGDYQLKPFARYERFNTAKAFAASPLGLERSADPYERVATVGANFYLSPSVVVKADYQRFAVNSLNNRFNLGLGWSF